MGMTIAEKILAKKSGREGVSPGDVVRASVDRAMVNDVTAPLTLDGMEEVGAKGVWDSEKIVIVIDHQVPANKVEAANDHELIRKFAREHKITNFYDAGEGVSHQLMLEGGHVLPGQLVVGADSHTCTCGAVGSFAVGIGSTDMTAVFVDGELWFRVPESIKIEVRNGLHKRVVPKDLILRIIGDIGVEGAIYRSIEFVGEGVERIGVSGRMTICNMGVEMGAKSAVVPPDEKTKKYVKERADEEFLPIGSDSDSDYVEERQYDASEIVPMVARPDEVDDVCPASDLEDITIDQAFLGSCTNGRLEDLAMAAEILGGESIEKKVRLIVAPASREIYLEALSDGVIGDLVEAGAMIQAPGCATCWGGHVGILAPGETCISSSNRNFKGRMGSSKAEIYLASPATVAASALTGEITDPRGV